MIMRNFLSCKATKKKKSLLTISSISNNGLRWSFELRGKEEY
nr:MAG TPA: hypothetical protein [Caudoviricetes sp.]